MTHKNNTRTRKENLIRQIRLKRSRLTRHRARWWRWKKGVRRDGVPRVKQNLPTVKTKGKDELEAIIAPINFCFNDNVEGVIEFFNLLEQKHRERTEIYVEMTNVLQIDYGSIVSLLAIMIKYKSDGLSFNGNFPANILARTLLENSGFFDILYKNRISHKNRYKFDTDINQSIVTHANKNVDSELGEKIIQDAAMTIWGEPRRCQGVQRTMLELMQNTNNHASESGLSGKQHWWLSIHHLPSEHKVCFAFVDHGIGVFNSLKDKPHSSKFGRWRDKLAAVLSLNNNSDILKMMLSGEFHNTVTGKYYRGKGLPGIAEAFSRKHLSSLVIITNNAHASLGKDIYKKLSHSFSGTYVYWEMDVSNVSFK